MCENGFDLNVRMASHGKFLAANRDVGLKLSQSDLILLVICIEVYISVPRPGHLLTFGSDNCCEGCLSTSSTSTTRGLSKSPSPVMTIKTGFRYCQMSPLGKIITSGVPSMHVSFKGMEGETKKEKGAAFRVGRREWVYQDEAQNIEKI